MIFKNFDSEYFEEEYNNKIDFFPQIVNAATKKGKSLWYLYSNACNCITLKLLKNETERNVLKEYFLYAMQGAVAHFRSIEKLKEPIKIRIGDTETEVTNDSTGFNDVIYWNSALIHAYVCRNREAIDELLTIPEKVIFSHDPQKKHSTAILYDIEKTLYQNKKVAKDKLDKYKNRALEINAADKDYLHYTLLPKYNLLYSFINKDSIAFNENLKMALDLYIEYHDTTEDNRNRYIDGWMPWWILSLACRAHDARMEITIKSELLPEFIIKGECNVLTLRG